MTQPTTYRLLTEAHAASTYATQANPQFIGTVGLPGGASGDKRLPVNGSVVIDGSTLPAGTSDKVAYSLAATFRGGFSAEAGYGQTNPAFAFGHNLFTVSGSTSGDLAGLGTVYGTLAEFHNYTPRSAITTQYAFQAETELAASAVGATVNDLMSIYAKGPAVNGGTVTGQAVSLRFDQPTTSGAGSITGLTLGLWGRGSALFEGLTPNAQGSRKGVWIGGGAASGGDPGVELADGTNTFRIDNTAGVLRILRAGQASLFEMTVAGVATFKQKVAIAGGGADAFSLSSPTQTAAPSAGGGSALPATPAGYVQITIGGNARWIPYY